MEMNPNVLLRPVLCGLMLSAVAFGASLKADDTAPSTGTTGTSSAGDPSEKPHHHHHHHCHCQDEDKGANPAPSSGASS
jgi:sugar (pentulose or hexulose) kinase